MRFNFNDVISLYEVGSKLSSSLDLNYSTNGFQGAECLCAFSRSCGVLFKFYYYAHDQTPSTPQKRKKNWKSDKDLSNVFFFFVNVVFTCTYYCVFHTLFALFGCKYLALTELTEGLTHWAICVLLGISFINTYIWCKPVSLHIQNAWEKNVQPVERLGDSGPIFMLLYCCIILWTVTFFVFKTTLNALYDQYLTGLLLRLFLVLCFLFMYMYTCICTLFL